jgi:tetratricopeptide (TPR) repeat protein
MLAMRRPGWFQMHDLLHAYAAELSDDPTWREQSDAALSRLGRWYAQTAAKAARALSVGPAPHQQAGSAADSGDADFTETAAAQNWCAREEVNLALLARKLAERGRDLDAIELARHAVDIYAFNNAFDCWYPTARLGSELAERTGDGESRAWFLDSLGKAHLQAGQPDQAGIQFAAALHEREQNADLSGQARSHNALGLLHYRTGHFAQAAEEFELSLELARRAGPADLRDFYAIPLMNLGMATLEQARLLPDDRRPIVYEKSMETLDTALDALHEDQDHPGLYHVTIHP